MNYSPLLIGHSHSILIFAAAKEVGFDLRGQPFAAGPQPPCNDEFTAFHPEIESELHQGKIYSLVNKSVHDILSIIRHPRPFDFIMPARRDLSVDLDAEIVPFHAFRAQLSRLMEPDLKTIAIAHSIVRDRLTQILSQPPLEDSGIVERLAPWPLEDGEFIASPSLRLKTYLVYASILSDWCSKRGIPLIGPPPETVNGNGFLNEMYYSNATHANVAYGHLVLKQIRETL